MVTSSDAGARRRWTDASIESELRAQSAELGHFPTRAELVAKGLRGLWDAMRSSSGGVDGWRERLDGDPSAPSSERDPSAPSREEIAVRAYELYAQGVPGDAETHWFAAEEELISKPAG